VVNEQTFGQLVQQVPGFALELMRLLARRLRKDVTR
jgi:CRP-like cAMP-binding protein